MARNPFPQTDDNGGFFSSPRRILSTAALGFSAMLGLSIVSGSWFTVDEYERGIVTRNGALLRIAEPGLDFKMPFIDSVKEVNITIQQFTTNKLNTITNDNQEIDGVLTVQYFFPASELGWIYKNASFTHEKLQAMVVDRWKILAGKTNATNFAENRGLIVSDLRAEVQKEAKRLFHIEVTDVQLSNLDYQPSFRAAQERAAVVKTEIEQAEGLNRKAMVEARTMEVQARAAATAVVEAAKGEAQRVEAIAKAQAESIRMRGEAEAGAQRAMADALTSNPLLVKMREAERWNGVLPANIYSGAPLPILNMQPTSK